MSYRRRNRDINIFNLSMLDVISSAMAAFLIIMIVLMPYYRKEHIDYQTTIHSLRDQLVEAVNLGEAAEARADAAETAATEARARADAERERANGLAQRLAKTFLVLYIRWNTADDIDLHVIDPSGAEFYYARKRIPGRPGELSEDTTNGPGNEVWEIRDAPPGNYQIKATLYAVKDARKPVVVQGRVFHRDGSAAFPEIRLHRPGQQERIVTIHVDSDGNVQLR